MYIGAKGSSRKASILPAARSCVTCGAMTSSGECTSADKGGTRSLPHRGVALNAHALLRCVVTDQLPWNDDDNQEEDLILQKNNIECLAPLPSAHVEKAAIADISCASAGPGAAASAADLDCSLVAATTSASPKDSISSTVLLVGSR